MKDDISTSSVINNKTVLQSLIHMASPPMLSQWSLANPPVQHWNSQILLRSSCMCTRAQVVTNPSINSSIKSPQLNPICILPSLGNISFCLQCGQIKLTSWKIFHYCILDSNFKTIESFIQLLACLLLTKYICSINLHLWSKSIVGLN